jgi:photosystem II stability/assembly factor-like uncharacterized protein
MSHADPRRSRAAPWLLAAAVIGCTASRAGAVGWTSIGPDGGPVHGFVQAPSDPQRLYALPKQSGVHRSDDRGVTWRRVDAGFPMDVVLLALGVSPVDRDLLLVAHGRDTVARSTDGGGTWDMRVIAADWTDVRQIEFDPHDPQVVLLAADRGPAPGIYRSTDAGLSWQRSHSGIASAGARGIAFHPSSPGTVLAATASGAYRSVDHAATWTPVDTDGETDVRSIDFCPGAPWRVWAGAGAVLRSDDGGATFTVAKPCTSVLCTLSRIVEAHPTDPDIVLSAEELLVSPAGGSGQNIWLWRTTNGGVDWDIPYHCPEAPQQNQRAAAIHFDPAAPQDVWLALSCPGGSSLRDGLLRSTDGGVTWKPAMAGIQCVRTLQIAFDLDGAMVLRAAGNVGLWRAADGEPWVAQPLNPVGGWDGYVPTWFDVDPGSTGLYHEVGWGPSGFDVVYGLLRRSTDGGQTWSFSFPPLFPFFSQPNLVIADRGGGVGFYVWDPLNGALFRSEDGGLSYTTHLASFPTEHAAVDPADPDRIFAVGDLTPVQHSTDGGVTWASRSQGLPVARASLIFLDPSDSGRLGVVYRTLGTYRSDDAGATWAPVPTGLGTQAVVDADWDPVGDRFAFATQDGGVYLQGAGWMNLRLATRDLEVVRFTPSADAIVLGTSHSSVLRLSIPAPQANVAEAPDGPPALGLRVYPNPSVAAEGVEIELSGTGRADATLEVFSVDGRRVRTIWSGQSSEAATVHWDGLAAGGERAPAGVYFVRLRAAGQSLTRRFVLLPR